MQSKSIFVSAVLLACAAWTVAGDKTCPSRAEIQPCRCWQAPTEDHEIDIDCNGVTDPEVKNLDLQAHLAQLRGKRIGEIYLTYIPLGRLPSDFFEGLHVRKLYIQDAELEGLTDTDDDLPFQGLEESLEKLTIDESFVGSNELKHFKLGHLRKLKEIFLMNNNIPVVKNEWFQGLQDLTELTVIRCEVKSIDNQVFASLPNLEYLVISDNEITELKRSMFPSPVNKLDNIILDHNQISTLPEDIFSDMPKLNYVDLEYNNLRQLPEATWSRVWGQLEQLYLYENPLECDSHIDWMFSQPRRPHTVSGICVSPTDRKGRRIEDLIDENKKDI